MRQSAAAATALSTFGNMQAVSKSLANAIKGIALSTSDANGLSIFGSGVTMSDAQANSIADAALSASNSACTSLLGGCSSIATVSCALGLRTVLLHVLVAYIVSMLWVGGAAP